MENFTFVENVVLLVIMVLSFIVITNCEYVIFEAIFRKRFRKLKKYVTQLILLEAFEEASKECFKFSEDKEHNVTLLSLKESCGNKLLEFIKKEKERLYKRSKLLAPYLPKYEAMLLCWIVVALFLFKFFTNEQLLLIISISTVIFGAFGLLSICYNLIRCKFNKSSFDVEKFVKDNSCDGGEYQELIDFVKSETYEKDFSLLEEREYVLPRYCNFSYDHCYLLEHDVIVGISIDELLVDIKKKYSLFRARQNEGFKSLVAVDSTEPIDSVENEKDTETENTENNNGEKEKSQDDSKIVVKALLTTNNDQCE